MKSLEDWSNVREKEQRGMKMDQEKQGPTHSPTTLYPHSLHPRKSMSFDPVFSVEMQSGVSPGGSRWWMGISRVSAMKGWLWAGGKQQAALSKWKSITERTILSDQVLLHNLLGVTKDSKEWNVDRVLQSNPAHGNLSLCRWAHEEKVSVPAVVG